MIINRALKISSQKLQNISDTSDLDSEVLLSHILKKDRAFLLANLDKKITAKQYKDFKKLINRREKHEPIAYITKQKEFYGLNFYVNKDVLIPRPETEILVESVLDVLDADAARTRSRSFGIGSFNSKSDRLQQAKRSNNLNILDVGAGSGCIAISLAENIPQAKIYATDISKKALKIAKINAKKHKVLNKIKFYHGNLLEPISKKIKFDIIIANLPYLSEKQYQYFVGNKNFCSLRHEPRSALIAKDHGLEFYIKLLKQIPGHIKKEGYIFLEIDPSFKNKIIEKTAEILKIKRNQIKIKPDLAFLDRIILIRF